MLGDLAPGGIRQEARPDLQDLEPHHLHCFSKGTVVQWKLVIDEIPVAPADRSDIWLEDEEATANAQNPMYLRESPEKNLSIREMFEEIASEDDINRMIAQELTKIMARREDDPRSRWSELVDIGIEVDGDPLGAPDVLEEFAVSGSQVEDRGFWWHVALKELGAEDLPDRGLPGAILDWKTSAIDVRQVHESSLSIPVERAIAPARAKPVGSPTTCGCAGWLYGVR
jgi:hypothetical protein